MKKLTKGLAAPVLAAALLLGVAAVPAWGYFTSSDWASGGIAIKGPDTDVKEKYGNGLKEVTIVNNEDSVPSWVRARAYCAQELNPTISSGLDENGTPMWTDTGKDWWNYNEILQPGESTKAPLLVSIEWEFTKEDVEENGTIITTTTGSDQGGETGGTSQFEVTANTAKGTNYNIVVVYEATPVIYDADGNALPADWS